MDARVMRCRLARWDLAPGEQAGMTFEQVLTVVNVRRVEIASALGLLTRIIEFTCGFRNAMMVGHIALTAGFLFAALMMRRTADLRLARGFVIAFLIVALVGAQLTVAAIGGSGRLTGGYLTMILSLALLFILPPRAVALGLAGLFVSYAAIVLNTPALPAEKFIALENAAIASVIAAVAAGLIHAGRRRDFEQKREIRLQNARLADRNAELDMLMAITAHDIRSPLYGLRNLFDLAIRRAPAQPDLPLTVLGQAMASVDAMLALATRLLDAHAAEHRPLASPCAEDVRGPILAAVDRIGPLARSGDVRIDADLPDGPLIARLDADGLAQILDNLLGNAVRHSPPGSTVTIGAVEEDGGTAIRIRDQGAGIDPARRHLLFRKFNRGGRGGTGSQPGMGMGLFIVATLAERMGATVRHEPNADIGATFVVTLPD